MYLTQNLRRSIQQTPNGIVSIFNGRKRTFAEFGDRVARFAGAMRKLGLKPGDRISMLALNSDTYLEYYLGTYWAGGVVNPINTRLAVPEIAFMLDDCGSEILMLDHHFVAVAAQLRARCPQLREVIFVGDGPAPDGMRSYEALIAAAEPAQDALRSNDDLAGIYYTGGTTGRSKGVMLTHTNIFSNSVAMIAEGVVARGCTGLHSAPMFHLADGAFMNAMLAGGGCHVIVPQFEPLAVLDVIQRERITDMLLVPTMIQMLVDHPKRAEH
ncbi:MAG TPA: AMP-binding protein, partial [Rubrivivax sp.]|nr:AMP-binding protein [Rubrivivax sp.]